MGPNILVMNHVVITPPYLPDNVREQKDSKDPNMKTLSYIRKIVSIVFYVVLNKREFIVCSYIS